MENSGDRSPSENLCQVTQFGDSLIRFDILGRPPLVADVHFCPHVGSDRMLNTRVIIRRDGKQPKAKHM